MNSLDKQTTPSLPHSPPRLPTLTCLPDPISSIALAPLASTFLTSSSSHVFSSSSSSSSAAYIINHHLLLLLLLLCSGGFSLTVTFSQRVGRRQAWITALPRQDDKMSKDQPPRVQSSTSTTTTTAAI